MSDLDQVCEEVVRQSRSNFALSFRFLPRRERRAMNALYAFCRRTDDIADGPGTAEEKRAALAAWRAELTERGRDPVIRAMVSVAADFGLAIHLLHAVIDGCEMDLEVSRFETLDDLRGYCALVAGAVGHLSLGIWGVHGARADALAEDLGFAVQVTNILRDVGADAGCGRIYMPLDLLRRHGVDESSILAREATPGLAEAQREMARLAREAYERADIPAFPRPDRRRLWPALIIWRIYSQLLLRIESRGFPLNERVSLPKLTKTLIALQVLLMRPFL